jgi:hypothetical protein
MSKYSILVEILDHLRGEASGTRYQPSYLPDPGDQEAVNQARSKAFVHMFLKVSFGLLVFEERQHFLTDGAYDGGVDAYFIDRDAKTLFFLQAKFRTTERNFESKPISLEELLVMDVGRMLKGETEDLAGNSYNGKIKQLIREVSEIPDISRYTERVIILANLEDLPPAKLMQLTGFPTEVFNHERSYRELVFPIISGTFFNASDLRIALDLSNKNAGTKISYEVATAHHDCEITVLFVPTAEIARVMHRYKNSILRFNPRSYLELDGHKVNGAIRESILNTTTNEFALFNNGITILSDETNINERIGQRNKAQLSLKNPQIINGGQTAYTLSRIYEENMHANADSLFQGKEVLLKVITLMDLTSVAATASEKLDLIDKISTASNQQTPVINADKNSNSEDHVAIQRTLFERYGVLYERKRGEFADGIYKGYISSTLLVERNLYFRLYYAVAGDSAKATEKKLFSKLADPLITLEDPELLDKLYYALLCFKRMTAGSAVLNRTTRNRTLYAKLYALAVKRPKELKEYPESADRAVQQLSDNWALLVNIVAGRRKEFAFTRISKSTGMEVEEFAQTKWFDTEAFREDVVRWFRS